MDNLNNQYKINICRKCFVDIGNDKECACGCKDVVYGDKFHTQDKTIICDCGCRNFSMTVSINCSSYHYTTYTCADCNNKIGTVVYIESYCEEEYND